VKRAGSRTDSEGKSVLKSLAREQGIRGTRSRRKSENTLESLFPRCHRIGGQTASLHLIERANTTQGTSQPVNKINEQQVEQPPSSLTRNQNDG